MKNLITRHFAFLLFVACIFCSCDNDDNVTYQFDTITFAVEKGDGKQYIQEQLSTILAINHGSTDMKTPSYDAYQNHPEQYYFQGDEALSNIPIEGDMPINIPINIGEDGTIKRSSLQFPYSEERTKISSDPGTIPTYTVPGGTQLEIGVEITIVKITLTFYASFINEHNEKSTVKGKYYYSKPVKVKCTTKLSDIGE